MPAADGPLRVAIDARYWRSAIQTGVERYILLLLEALHTADQQVDVGVVLTAKEQANFPTTVHPAATLLTVPDRRAASLTRALQQFAPDVVHYPFDLPATFSHPSVYTLHDPGRYLYPQLMVRKVRDVQNDRLRPPDRPQPAGDHHRVPGQPP